MFFFSLCGDHRDLHVLTHSFPTRLSSDLAPPGNVRRPPCGEYRRPPSSMDRSCGNAPVSVVVTQDSHADGCWESEHCRTAKVEVPVTLTAKIGRAHV